MRQESDWKGWGAILTPTSNLTHFLLARLCLAIYAGTLNNMKPAQLIAAAQELDPDAEILCQVVSGHGQAWNMDFHFTPGSKIKSPGAQVWFNVLTISHPEMQYLPANTDEPSTMEKCDAGHRYVRLTLSHPMRNGKPLCVHCLAGSK